MKTVIRVEGVNLSCVLDDANDLSTRRGGGMMLLDATKQIEDALQGQATAVSTGASAAVLTLNDGQDAKTALSNVREALKKNDLQHFTFVSAAATGPTLAQAENQALAACRWQQQQSLALAVPTMPEKTGAAVCALDGVRPAEKAYFPPEVRSERKEKLSASVYARRENGRRLRKNLYNDIVGKEFFVPIVIDDLQTLGSPLDSEKENVGNLRDKICLIYADGNGFGRVGQDAAKVNKLAKWDAYIKDERKKLLKKLLNAAQADDRMAGANNVLRLETLLWGGDEFIFVVPAWCGFPVWRFLYEHSRDWSFDDTPLTHAFSLVFAHSKAPIHRLVNLAKDLAEKGKAKTKVRATLTWTALESFDHMGLDLDAALEKRYRKKIAWNDWVLSAESAIAMDDVLCATKQKLPRSQIVSGAMASIHDAIDASEKRMEHAQTQVFNQEAGGDVMKTLINSTLTKDSNAASAWVHLAEAWDYAGHAALGAQEHVFVSVNGRAK